jgi:hypothetical protein
MDRKELANQTWNEKGIWNLLMPEKNTIPLAQA